MCNSASRHRRRDARDPEVEQPIEPAQRVRREYCPRRRRLAWRCHAEAIEHAIGDDLAPAAGQPVRHRSCVVGSGRNQDRAIPGKPPQIARLFQITCRIVQPEQPAPGFSNEADDPVAAIADVKITFRRNSVRQRRPVHTLVAEWGEAAVAHRNPVAAPRQGFGERRECRLRPAEGPPLRRCPVKGDPVIGHHHLSHHPLRLAPSPRTRGEGRGEGRLGDRAGP